MTDSIKWGAFQWEGRSELWDEVLGQLENFQSAECDAALSPDLGNEQRHYTAGKAASLAEFRSHLTHLREMAIQHKK
jgi:hypothetical protein